MDDKIEQITYRLFYNDNKSIPDDFEYFEKYRREHNVYYNKAKILIRTEKIKNIIK